MIPTENSLYTKALYDMCVAIHTKFAAGDLRQTAIVNQANNNLTNCSIEYFSKNVFGGITEESVEISFNYNNCRYTYIISELLNMYTNRFSMSYVDNIKLVEYLLVSQKYKNLLTRLEYKLARVLYKYDTSN